MIELKDQKSDPWYNFSLFCAFSEAIHSGIMASAPAFGYPN